MDAHRRGLLPAGGAEEVAEVEGCGEEEADGEAEDYAVEATAEGEAEGVAEGEADEDVAYEGDVEHGHDARGASEGVAEAHLSGVAELVERHGDEEGDG